MAANETLLLEEDQESEQNNSECELGDVDEAQQQQPQGGRLERRSMGDGWEGSATIKTPAKHTVNTPLSLLNMRKTKTILLLNLSF
jgi:hypothetical protein